jgi:hypothetical protein
MYPGVVHRGPGSVLDPELVQADIERLEEADGALEDPQGHLACWTWPCST